MKQIITLVAFTCGLCSLYGQQTAQYSLYMLNKFNFNPAYAGLENSLSLTGVYRQQWTNLPGSPTSQSINVHSPFYFASGGLGLAFENESLGAWQHININLAYNYQIPLRNGSVFSIGFAAGISQRSLDGSELRTPDGQYSIGTNPDIINHFDDQLPNGEISGMTPNFSVGAYFQGEQLEIGFAAQNISEATIDLDGELNFQLDRSFYFNVGYRLDVGQKLSVMPSLLLKSNVVQNQLDFSTVLRYNDNIFIGGSFRGYNADSADAIAIIGGFNLSSKITIAYAYDISISDLSQVNDGSHEILLNYNLGKAIGKGKPPRIIYNPRNL